jgi:sulfur carrier protein
MKLIVNGKACEAADGATLDALVRTVTAAVSGVAVAVNDEVVRRGSWASTPLNDGDRVEVLTAVQGG